MDLNVAQLGQLSYRDFYRKVRDTIRSSEYHARVQAFSCFSCKKSVIYHTVSGKLVPRATFKLASCCGTLVHSNMPCIQAYLRGGLCRYCCTGISPTGSIEYDENMLHSALLRCQLRDKHSIARHTILPPLLSQGSIKVRSKAGRKLNTE